MVSLTIPPGQYELSTASIDAAIDGLQGKVQSFEGTERRAHTRYVVALPSIVQPLDEHYQPLGKPFNATTRDISAGGIRLINSQPVTDKFLGIKLLLTDGTDLELLVEVRRCVSLGSYYDVAGEFVTTSE